MTILFLTEYQVHASHPSADHIKSLLPTDRLQPGLALISLGLGTDRHIRPCDFYFQLLGNSAIQWSVGGIATRLFGRCRVSMNAFWGKST